MPNASTSRHQLARINQSKVRKSNGKSFSRLKWFQGRLGSNSQVTYQITQKCFAGVVTARSMF